jgi:pyruvate,water dikinase
VVTDRYELSRVGHLRHIHAGRKDDRVVCFHREVPTTEPVPQSLVSEPCLNQVQAAELGRLLLETEQVMGMPVEIEWALDDAGFKLLQARPLHTQAAEVPDEIWLKHPRLNGHPAGVGWGSGRACVINCECELSRVAPGDVLVTRGGAGVEPHLTQVAGVVAERGGSTSHMASLARERGIPMVLGAGCDRAHSLMAPWLRWTASPAWCGGWRLRDDSAPAQHPRR